MKPTYRAGACGNARPAAFRAVVTMLLCSAVLALSGCAAVNQVFGDGPAPDANAEVAASVALTDDAYDYLIGPGDVLVIPESWL